MTVYLFINMSIHNFLTAYQINEVNTIQLNVSLRRYGVCGTQQKCAALV